jgi:galactokinase
MNLIDVVSETFKKHFSTKPAFVVRAPGRVNLIGEHTDYNDGFVLPMAIDRAVYIALRPREDKSVRLYSIDFDAWGEFNLDNLQRDSGWLEYPKGVAWALQVAGLNLSGFEGVMTGDVPRGAGLSSSAAIELATAKAFHCVSNFNWDAKQMALLGQKAENKWVGVNCGIMDQLISAVGQKDHAVLIDCRSLDLQAVPLPANTVVVVMDTNTRRGLVDSAYNERRSQCEEAATFLGVKALRDVTLQEFENRKKDLSPLTYKRAKHVVSENERTVQAAQAMKQGNAALLGQLMNESHVSLRDDFEVSSNALNVIVECALVEDGCYGARMTGAGFGGCGVALVKADHADTFAKNVVQSYKSKTGQEASIYVCSANDGASGVSAS